MKSEKTILITGGATRIGRTISHGLAADGWNVAIHYLNSTKEAQKTVSEIEQAGGKATSIKADLSKEKEVEKLVKCAADALNAPLTCLINNASVFDQDTLMTATSKSWSNHMGVNLHAPFILTQQFASNLPPNVEGNVINMLDQRVWNLNAGFVSYTVSKSALWTLTRTLALELAPIIRVNGIGPGPVLPSSRQSDNHFKQQAKLTPLRRPADVQDILSAVKFLITTPSITGQMIAVDSGQHLTYSSYGALE